MHPSDPNYLSNLKNPSVVAAELGLSLPDEDALAITVLAETLARGVAEFMAFGIGLVALIDKNYSYKAIIAEALQIPTILLSKFEKVGRGELHPMLMYAATPGERNLSKLPISDQDKYINEPVTLLLEDGDRLMVSVKDLTSEQSKQVFGNSEIRSISSQKAWLSQRNKSVDATEVVKAPSYTITKKKLIVKVGKMEVHFSDKQVKEFARQMG